MTTITADTLPPIDATTRDEVDSRLATLAAAKDRWVRVPIEERVEILRACIDGMLRISDTWVTRACEAKGVDPRSSWAGEEWISGPMVTIRYLRLLAEALEADARPRPATVRAGVGGQTVLNVFPDNRIDRTVYAGIKADIWIEPGRLPTQGRIYRDKLAGRDSRGRVALVLGAGNVGSIAPTDLLHKLFIEDQVTLVKMNPVNEYLGPLLRDAFEPLVEDGYLELAYGGPEVGSYLCSHPVVDTIHLTGSDKTYDAIVWGATAEERSRRKSTGDPIVTKPFTAELGCVSPVIVAPGRWTTAEIDFQARNVASMVVHNASFNCNAAKVLVLPNGWRQREEFLGAVVTALSRVPGRRAYYPGARKRYEAFLERYPDAMVLSKNVEDVPWTLIPDVPARPGEYALCNEAFCGILAEVRLDAGRTGDPATFLANATRFVNESVWGTLSCTLLVGKAAKRALGDGLERAVAELRYGDVGVNVWPAALFALGVTTWGAYPGHTPEKIGSGIGTVHNSSLFDHPQRSVAWAPPVTYPKPPWFADHRNAHAVGKRIARFEAAPSMAGLPRLGLSALLG
jgi:hypothetical protein